MKKVAVLAFFVVMSLVAIVIIFVQRRFVYTLSWLPPPGIKKLHTTFDDTVSALRGINAKYALAYGTALGVVRENDLIQRDRDVDFAMFYEDLPSWDTLNRAMASHGFECPAKSTPYSWECHGRQYPILFQYRHRIIRVGCDIGVMYRRDDGTWDFGGARPGTGHRFISRPGKPEMNEIHFRGHEHSIFPVEWLKEQYGESWMTPLPDDKGRPSSKCTNETSCIYPPPE
jgi:hypothetical protein